MVLFLTCTGLCASRGNREESADETTIALRIEHCRPPEDGESFARGAGIRWKHRHEQNRKADRRGTTGARDQQFYSSQKFEDTRDSEDGFQRRKDWRRHPNQVGAAMSPVRRRIATRPYSTLLAEWTDNGSGI